MTEYIWVPNPAVGERSSTERLHHDLPTQAAWESAGDMAQRAEKQFGPGYLYRRVEVTRRPSGLREIDSGLWTR
jgi:hypothetical protein